ncbi:hypothetical protein [Variovorax paradoxus]|jgi:hypothetical protein|uniref:hypothetical protein n=2 Tax=Comamonadaceae TaxID=80864 RepID=UPI003994638C
MELLRRIEDASFPLVIADEKDVRSAIVLEAAGMIKAQLPSPERPDGRPAVIFAITPLGRRRLNEGSAQP